MNNNKEALMQTADVLSLLADSLLRQDQELRELVRELVPEQEFSSFMESVDEKTMKAWIATGQGMALNRLAKDIARMVCMILQEAYGQPGVPLTPAQLKEHLDRVTRIKKLRAPLEMSDEHISECIKAAESIANNQQQGA